MTFSPPECSGAGPCIMEIIQESKVSKSCSSYGKCIESAFQIEM